MRFNRLILLGSGSVKEKKCIRKRYFQILLGKYTFFNFFLNSLLCETLTLCQEICFLWEVACLYVLKSAWEACEKENTGMS